MSAESHVLTDKLPHRPLGLGLLRRAAALQLCGLVVLHPEVHSYSSEFLQILEWCAVTGKPAVRTVTQLLWWLLLVVSYLRDMCKPQMSRAVMRQEGKQGCQHGCFLGNCLAGQSHVAITLVTQHLGAEPRLHR